MDIITIITNLGLPAIIIGSIFGAIIDLIIAYLKKHTPYLKRIWVWIINKPYKLRVFGFKTYDLTTINLETIKKQIYDEYDYVKLISEKKNSLIILIDDMQAPYEILISNDDNETQIKITLIGNVKLKYRFSEENEKIFNTLNELFEIIEIIINKKHNYSLYSLEADFKNNFKKKPFTTEHLKEKCENTKVNLDRNSKFIKINSKSKDNLSRCLKKNIHKII